MSISELSRIYPTPPSVETVEVDKFEEAKEERAEHNCLVNSTATTQWNTSYVCHSLNIVIYIKYYCYVY